jgi:murein DD-endopeptidase MepM/ murein hydrolase activator NlpD
VTQEFGEHPEWYERFGLSGHNGRDISVLNYDPQHPPALVATMPGVCWPYWDSDYGWTVEVWYPSLQAPVINTIQAHMIRQPEITLGQQIEARHVLVYMGSTGNSTGPHVHYGVKPLRGGAVNPGFRGWIDPRFWLVR